MGQSYRDLIAWQKAMDFVRDVYRTSKSLPRDELIRAGWPAKESGGWSADEYGRGASAFLGQRIPLLLSQDAGIAGRG